MSETLVKTVRDFITTEVLPIDDAFDGDINAAGGETTRTRLQALAREAGILSPHGPVEYGGLGLNMTDRAPIFEAAGHSLFGPLALNIAAPDEGNIHMLHLIAEGTQRESYLAPLTQGDARSAFAMTEPSPGAGADPNAMLTTATKVEGGWVINGRKHLITGAYGATFFIVMARTPSGATMFLVPAEREGIELVRHIPTVDLSMIGGHAEMTFTDVFVPEDDVLGEVGQGFKYAQVRLGPARMTHVMRWSGAAHHAHQTAVRYASQRQAFGSRIADLGLAQQLIADNEIDLAATKALLMVACTELDNGGRASKETSIAKTFAAEALHRVVDRSLQLCGGIGASADLPIARILREIRLFRIYDGPSEVHRWSLAKRAVRELRAGHV
ncbi:MAG TPA: acyl-CoA dehydrogenase family protein [Nocardioidaceae bacterium]|nr:acyl-CoA dehydrogenase family protein [Nocardioidaceae bacterium]